MHTFFDLIGISPEQTLVFAILLAALALFIWGRWRYDIVALMVLCAATLGGIIPAREAFSGFGHPAVITVAAVLVISRALSNAGAIDLVAKALAPLKQRTLQVGGLAAMVAVCSAFMNNVGALAVLMPVAIRSAQSANRSPSEVLMPLSFGSLLGGLITLIGTPPNLIIAEYRAEFYGIPFRMFDFTPVGAGVALAGVVFIALVGWHLVPRKHKVPAEREKLFEIEDYTAEARLPAKSKLVGQPLRTLEELAEGDVAIVGLVRGKQRMLAPSRRESLRARDTLVLEGDPSALEKLVENAKLKLLGSKDLSAEKLRSDDIMLTEAVITPGSRLEGRTAHNMRLHTYYDVNLLAVARHGQRVKQRLGELKLRAGDVLLLQGEAESMGDTLNRLGALPLAERGLTIGTPRRLIAPLAIFAAAIVFSMSGVLPVYLAFVGAVVLLIVFDLIPLRDAYDAVDWPIIILIAAMIPVGRALATTGGAELIANSLVTVAGDYPAVVLLTLVIVASMWLSDVINNAATAVVMAPIAASIAANLGVNGDAFLMAVAVGASCTFLTPIGHQSNTLVMGPGGYSFSDYWRMGLPLGFVVVAVAVPLILLVWPM
jgi:di/tricarboxylate transporter